jgi:N-acetylglucosamine-6-phosphate deacetylase
MRFAIAARRVFDGARILDDHAVVVEEERIAGVVPAGDVGTGVDVRRVDGLLAPGFIDVQVNGGGGVLFNDQPTVDGIRAIGAAHRRFGTTGFLPTLITDAREKMVAAIEAVRAGLAAGVPGLLGIHFEGPFISKAFKGAHDTNHIRKMEDADVSLITSVGRGRTMITLSPDPKIVRPEQIARLREAGVRVSIGHTDASYEAVIDARRNGATGYTHLFNAMPDLKKRGEPGAVAAALENSDGWCSIIADLEHVSAPVLRIALRAKGTDRTMLVTDAMSPTGTALASFDLTGTRVHRRNGRLEFDDGTLAGADLDMATAVRNAHRKLGVGITEALNMAARVPAAFLGLQSTHGRVAAGCLASLVLLDDDLQVRSTWIEGVEERVT